MSIKREKDISRLHQRRYLYLLYFWRR